ncbi:hypothetical protein ACSBR2_011994 [Camellia fascicularis]
MVKWEEITQSKSNGGLGIRNVRIMNECLLLKWWWRFGSESGSIWKQVILSKYP